MGEERGEEKEEGEEGRGHAEAEADYNRRVLSPRIFSGTDGET